MHNAQLRRKFFSGAKKFLSTYLQIMIDDKSSIIIILMDLMDMFY